MKNENENSKKGFVVSVVHRIHGELSDLIKRQILVSNFRLLKLPILVIVSAFLVTLLFSSQSKEQIKKEIKTNYWEIQSIDTVKYSRDLAREKLRDDSFRDVINNQVKNIASVGVTHIALGTPYDEEFIPYLQSWVDAARANGVGIWFRGNFSGWEEWFDYPPISQEEHKNMLVDFIKENPGLFEDGDIFTPCTECENGEIGDPRQTGDVEGYRSFLIDEYEASKVAFEEIGKGVETGYFSMNADVARLVMDQKTTEALGGIVVIDHYVKDPEKLAGDVDEISSMSGGEVVLGEFGAPIPDIHGDMSKEQQSDWVRNVLSLVSKKNSLVGVNYWVSFEGTTAIWESDGSEKPTVAILRSYYSPQIIKGKLTNDIGKPIKNALIIADSKESRSNSNGEFNILSNPSLGNIIVISPGYKKENVIFNQNLDLGEIVLKKEKEGLFFRIQVFLYMISRRLGL